MNAEIHAGRYADMQVEKYVDMYAEMHASRYVYIQTVRYVDILT